MIIPEAALTTTIVPAAAPVLQVVATLTPPAGQSYNHVAGSAIGVRLTYGDLNAFSWYKGRLNWRRFRVGVYADDMAPRDLLETNYNRIM